MADVSRLPGPNADIWDWQMDGVCRGEDPNIFFHPEGERGAARENRQNAAKALCNRCPVITECAAHALSVREPYGVWGGMTEEEREAIYSRRRISAQTFIPAPTAKSEDRVSASCFPEHEEAPSQWLGASSCLRSSM